MPTPEELYRNRKLVEGYPDLGRLYHEYFVNQLQGAPEDSGRITRLVTLLGRAVSVDAPKKMVVVGCGPHPTTIEKLLEMGHEVTGVEPIASYVETANEYLARENAVVEGTAENIPLPDNSQDVAFFEWVLEHVDSTSKSLAELFRILRPGGILYLSTTNRYRVGANDEFRVWFYAWLPAVVKESYIHRHLHYAPHLANYSTRPAVHWFCYSDLCRLGREAGFAQFYSAIDLKRPDDFPGKSPASMLKRFIIRRTHGSAWLRALSLLQRGKEIVMVKRPHG